MESEMDLYGSCDRDKKKCYVLKKRSQKIEMRKLVD